MNRPKFKKGDLVMMYVVNGDEFHWLLGILLDDWIQLLHIETESGYYMVMMNESVYIHLISPSEFA